LIILIAIPIGLLVWAFQGAGDLIGELPEVGIPQQTAEIPSTGPTRDQPASPTRANFSQQPIGNLGQPVGQEAGSLADLYDRVHTGAVSISVQVNQGGMVGAGAGSGFVLSDNGYIITNHHVVEGADQLLVVFFNDDILVADFIGSDPDSDLAVIKVDQLPADVIPLPIADMETVRVGDEVVAIGNPFGVGTSMSYGIVSALGRAIPSGFTQFNIPEAIQTDAAINPGNSGGPLINMNGEVIGVNAQIRTTGEGGGSIGIGFAIPANILNLVYPSIIENGDYDWPYLGVTGANLVPLIAEEYNIDPNARGAFIGTTTAGGPAQAAGLREGDVVVGFNGSPVRSFDALLSLIAFSPPGQEVTLTILRDGDTFDVPVTLDVRPEGSQIQ
jgi:2-alkenal reductase